MSYFYLVDKEISSESDSDEYCSDEYIPEGTIHLIVNSRFNILYLYGYNQVFVVLSSFY